MVLSREEIEQISKAVAQNVMENLHRYTKEYSTPSSIEQGLSDSMIEERTAVDWYKKRATHARELGDELTGGLYNHIAEEEEQHYREFKNQLKIKTFSFAGVPSTEHLLPDMELT